MPHQAHFTPVLAVLLLSLLLAGQLPAIASAAAEDASGQEHKAGADPGKHKAVDAPSAAVVHTEPTIRRNEGAGEVRPAKQTPNPAGSATPDAAAEPTHAPGDNSYQHRKLAALSSPPDVHQDAAPVPPTTVDSGSNNSHTLNSSQPGESTNDSSSAAVRPSVSPAAAAGQSGQEPAAHPEKHKRPPLPIPSPDDFAWEQEAVAAPLADAAPTYEAKHASGSRSTVWPREGAPAGATAPTQGSNTGDVDVMDNSDFDEVPQDPGQRYINLASAADGASVVAVNKEARKPEKTIDGDDDSYMKNQCSAHKWLIIELSQLGRVDEVQLLNKEMYSSRVRDFSVKGRQVHPRKDGPAADYPKWFDTEHWQLLGNFTAPNKKGGQSFKMQVARRVRYLLLQFHTHYGSEEMCALNSIRVLGVSAAQELEEALARHLNGVPTLDIPHHPAARQGPHARTVPIIPPTIPAPTQIATGPAVLKPTNQPLPPPPPPVYAGKVVGLEGQQPVGWADGGSGVVDATPAGPAAAASEAPAEMHCQEVDTGQEQRCYSCMSHAAELLIGAGISMACRPHMRGSSEGGDDGHYDTGDDDYRDEPLPGSTPGAVSAGGVGVGDVRPGPVEPKTPPPAKPKSGTADRAPQLPSHHHTTIIITPTGDMEAVVLQSEPILPAPPIPPHASATHSQPHDSPPPPPPPLPPPSKQSQPQSEGQDAERKPGAAAGASGVVAGGVGAYGGAGGSKVEPAPGVVPQPAVKQHDAMATASKQPAPPSNQPSQGSSDPGSTAKAQQSTDGSPTASSTTVAAATVVSSGVNGSAGSSHSGGSAGSSTHGGSSSSSSTTTTTAAVSQKPAGPAAPPVTPPSGPPPVRPPGYPTVPPPAGANTHVDPGVVSDTGVRVPPVPSSTAQVPVDKAGAGGGTEPVKPVAVVLSTEPVLSTAYLDTVLTMEGGPSAKPKQSGNLFDLFKQEFVLLRLNQSRMWKYMHSLVEVLNHNAAEAAAEVAALDGQVNELKAKLAVVPAQVEADVTARLTALHNQQFETLARQIAEMKQQVAESRLRECALLMYISCALALLLGVTLGQAGAAGGAGGRPSQQASCSCGW